MVLGVPAGKRRSGFTLVAFCCGCNYFSSVSPHVENCVCFLSTAKRLPLQSLTQRQKCTSLYIFDCEFCLTSKHRVCLIPAASVPLLSVHPWHPLHMSLLIANSLLRGTTAFHGSSELDVRVNSWTRAFAVLTRTKNYIIFFEILSHFCIRDI